MEAVYKSVLRTKLQLFHCCYTLQMCKLSDHGQQHRVTQYLQLTARFGQSDWGWIRQCQSHLVLASVKLHVEMQACCVDSVKTVSVGAFAPADKPNIFKVTHTH